MTTLMTALFDDFDRHPMPALPSAHGVAVDDALAMRDDKTHVGTFGRDARTGRCDSRLSYRHEGMLVTDLGHFLDLPDNVPGPARRLAEQLSLIVRAATAVDPGFEWVSALPCRRRPGRRACPGHVGCAAPMFPRRSSGGAPRATTPG